MLLRSLLVCFITKSLVVMDFRFGQIINRSKERSKRFRRALLVPGKPLKLYAKCLNTPRILGAKAFLPISIRASVR